jgi:DNA repair exonuclease SbcCD ATPase subunit
MELESLEKVLSELTKNLKHSKNLSARLGAALQAAEEKLKELKKWNDDKTFRREHGYIVSAVEFVEKYGALLLDRPLNFILNLPVSLTNLLE